MIRLTIDGWEGSGRKTLALALARSWSARRDDENGVVVLDTDMTTRSAAWACARRETPGAWLGAMTHTPHHYIDADERTPNVLEWQDRNVTRDVADCELDPHVHTVQQDPHWRAAIHRMNLDVVTTYSAAGIIAVGRDTATSLLTPVIAVCLWAELGTRRRRLRTEYLQQPQGPHEPREPRVEPPTPRDIQSWDALRLLPGAFLVDTTHVSPAVVRTRVEDALADAGIDTDDLADCRRPPSTTLRSRS